MIARVRDAQGSMLPFADVCSIRLSCSKREFAGVITDMKDIS